MERAAVEAWIAGYVGAWRSPGTDPLDRLFTPDASYLPSPWATPIVGREALAAFWDAEREGPDEEFTFASEIVAVDGDVAVARIAVDYGPEAHWTGRWRDLWVMRFGPDGRCAAFEEWPFAPGQPDGH